MVCAFVLLDTKKMGFGNGYVRSHIICIFMHAHQDHELSCTNKMMVVLVGGIYGAINILN